MANYDDYGFEGGSRPGAEGPGRSPRQSLPEPRERRGGARKVMIVGGVALATAAAVLAATLLPRRAAAEGDPGASLLPLGGGSGEPPPPVTTWDNADAVGCSLRLRARSRFFARREDTTHQRYLDNGTSVTILETSTTTSSGRDRKCRVRLAGGAEGWVFIGPNEISVCPRRPAAGLHDNNGFSAPADDDGPLGADHFGYGGRSEHVAGMAADCAAAYLELGGAARAAIWDAVGAHPALSEDVDALAGQVARWLEGAARGEAVEVDGFLFCRAVRGGGGARAPEAPAGEPTAPAGCATCGGLQTQDVSQPAPESLPAGYERMHGPEVIAPEATVRFGNPGGLDDLWPVAAAAPVPGVLPSPAVTFAPRRTTPRRTPEPDDDPLYGRP